MSHRPVCCLHISAVSDHGFDQGNQVGSVQYEQNRDEETDVQVRS